MSLDGSLTVGNDGFSGSLGLSIDLILLKIGGTAAVTFSKADGPSLAATLSIPRVPA